MKSSKKKRVKTHLKKNQSTEIGEPWKAYGKPSDPLFFFKEKIGPKRFARPHRWHLAGRSGEQFVDEQAQQQRQQRPLFGPGTGRRSDRPVVVHFHRSLGAVKKKTKKNDARSIDCFFLLPVFSTPFLVSVDWCRSRGTLRRVPWEMGVAPEVQTTNQTRRTKQKKNPKQPPSCESRPVLFLFWFDFGSIFGTGGGFVFGFGLFFFVHFFFFLNRSSSCFFFFIFWSLVLVCFLRVSVRTKKKLPTPPAPPLDVVAVDHGPTPSPNRFVTVS